MRVVCVDGDASALQQFESVAAAIPEIKQLMVFQSAQEARTWIQHHPADAVFLETRLPDATGIELAGGLRQIDGDIRIFFLTEHREYALEAFGVRALGYILKPYQREQIQEAVDFAMLVRKRPRKKVVIQTIPSFALWIDGRRMKLSGAKRIELLALLVDHGATGITAGEAIACLWPGRPADEKTQTLYRVTFHQMLEELKKEDIAYIVSSVGQKKFLRMEQVDCDLYHILEGHTEYIENYGGDYLQEYSWAEARNAQLGNLYANQKKV